MPLSEDGKGKQISVMTSHCDGEVWGLEVVTLDDGSLRILTSADDNRILAYNGGAGGAVVVAEYYCWGK